MKNKINELLNKKEYTVDDLITIMKILRSEQGCPWDREQNHKSIRNNLIEETYEVIEAIDTDNFELLKEELGDLLLQIVFHSEMESEKGNFDITSVANDICKKLIVRHPHIFSDVCADDTETVLKNWDAIKMQTKGQKDIGEVLDGIAKSLPALMYAEKINSKMIKHSCDVNIPKYDKLDEYVSKNCTDSEDLSDYIGECLFAITRICAEKKISAEESLYNTCKKYTKKFNN